jgi:hypothetical protein
MKLSQTESAHSVYESFSDLLLNKLMILMFVIVGIMLAVAKKQAVPVKAEKPEVQIQVQEKVVVVEKKVEVPVEVLVPNSDNNSGKKTLVIAYDGKCEVVFVSTGKVSFSYDAFKKIVDQINGDVDFAVTLDTDIPAKYKSAAEELCGKVAGLQKVNGKRGTVKPRLVPETDSVFVGDVEFSTREFASLVNDLDIVVQL